MLRIIIRLIALCCLLYSSLISLSLGLGTLRNHDLISFMAEFNDETDIYLYDPTRHELINITATNYPEWSFGWSNSGALLYTASANFSQAADDLFVMSRLGDAQQINTPDTLASFGGVWSPDGNTLAYFSSHPSNHSDIYIIRFPDRHVHNLTQTATINESNPLWSPDGTQLLYRSYGNLYLYDLQTNERILLLDLAETIEMPVWSPDAQWIAFYLRRYLQGHNTLDAFIVSQDGQEVLPLNAISNVGESPITWSPDSQQIALIADENDLIIYDLASHNIQRIAGENRRFAPAWSPMGRWIAFIENRQLKLYDLHTGAIHVLQAQGLIKAPLIWQP